MLRSLLVVSVLLAVLVPVAARAVPAIEASPAALEPNSVTTVRLSLVVDSRDAVAVAASLQALGGTTLRLTRELQIPGDLVAVARDPRSVGFTFGDGMKPLPEGTLPFAEVEISAGGPGDHVALAAVSFVLIDGSEASLSEGLLIKVGGDVPPTRPSPPREARRPAAPAPGGTAPAGLPSRAPRGESASGPSLLDRLFSPLGGLVIAGAIVIGVYVAALRLGRGTS
jgi:hypothetical protein